MECIYCAETTFKNNPTFCSHDCQDKWVKKQEEKLATKLMVRVNPVTWIMVSKKKPRKERKAWKRWMAAGRKLMKKGKEDKDE